MSLSEAADFQRKIYEFQKDVSQHLEMMAAAYLKATDIPIEECELVVETLPNKMVYRFQRRPTQLAQDLLPVPACCASFFLDGTHHKDCRFAQSANL